MKNEDVALINRILAGDEAAFVSLVEKYQKQVHALAWRKIGDFHIAEEITQDTFLKVYQKLATLKDPNQFSGWLYVIATRQCLTWLRKKRIETESLEGADTEWIDESAYSRYVAEEHAKTTVETQREVVKKLLAKLKESERTVMTLHYFGEMTVEEISRFLGVSTSAIKLRLHRARQRLKKEEPMIQEALSNFQLSPNLTENIMRKIDRIKPAAPSGSKPLMPWVIGASSIALIVLMLGIGSQDLARFQQPYSLDAQSEMTVELMDVPIVLNLEAKPNVRNQLGEKSDDPRRGNGTGQESNQLLSDKSDYTRWGLPKNAKARLGKGNVREVAYSPDGNRLAIASGTGIWLYDAHTGRELDLLTGHTGSVLTVAFSPDGNTIASGSKDNTVMLWDALTGKHKQTLIGHENIVTCVVFNPDGSILASASFDSHVRLWDMSTGRLIKITQDARSSITHITFNPNGDTIAGSTLGDNIVFLWDVATGKVKDTLEIVSQFAGDVAFSHDGEKIAINCSSDHNIQFWDISTRQYEGTLYGHRTSTMDIAFSSDGNTFASICYDGTLRLWNYNEEFLLKVRTGRNQPKATLNIDRMRRLGWMHIIFSTDSSTIACAGEDGTVMLFDIATRELKATLLGHTQSVKSIAFNPDGSIIASGKGNQLLLWDVNNAELMESLNAKRLNVRSVAFNQNGNTLASGNSDNTLLLWDVATGQQKAEIIVPLLESNIRSEIGSVTFSPNGSILASCGGHEDFSVYLWDVATGQLKSTLKGHKHNVNSIAFSPNGNTLASSSTDETIKLWDVPTGKLKTTLTGHTGVVFSVAFNANGNALASGAGYNDGTIRLWDLSSGKNTKTLKSPSGFVLCVAFSPDGNIIASGNTDQTVELWNIPTQQQIATFTGHRSNVDCVAFSPDGKTLASGSGDGTILLWDLTSLTNTNQYPR